MKRCPTSLVNREILIKTTKKYHFICTKMAKIKKKTIITNVGKDMENQELSYISGVTALKWYSHFGEVWQFPKKLIINLPEDPVLPFPLSTQKICNVFMQTLTLEYS